MEEEWIEKSISENKVVYCMDNSYNVGATIYYLKHKLDKFKEKLGIKSKNEMQDILIYVDSLIHDIKYSKNNCIDIDIKDMMDNLQYVKDLIYEKIKTSQPITATDINKLEDALEEVRKDYVWEVRSYILGKLARSMKHI